MNCPHCKADIGWIDTTQKLTTISCIDCGKSIPLEQPIKKNIHLLFTIQKILLTQYAIGKWIHSNVLSENPTKVYIPLNVYWEVGPIYYMSSSTFGKLQIWFYSIAIPFIIYKILEPALTAGFTYLRTVNVKLMAAIFSYGLMICISIAIAVFLIKSIRKTYKEIKGN